MCTVLPSIAGASFSSSYPPAIFNKLFTRNDFPVLNPSSAEQPKFIWQAEVKPTSICFITSTWLYATYFTGKYVTIVILLAPAAIEGVEAHKKHNPINSFFIFSPFKAFLFGQNGLLYAFLYTGYIRVYPALIFKILAKKKTDTTL